MSWPHSPLRRKCLLGATGVTALAMVGGLLSCRPLIKNACRVTLPQNPALQALIAEAWQGIDATRVWDMHVHLAGTGDSGSGIEISPDMTSALHPFMYAQRQFYMNAGCANNTQGQVDSSYIARLQNLCMDMPEGFRLLLFAFDKAYDENGEVVPDSGTLYVPNHYARDVAHALPSRFEWACSVHPYRKDAVNALRDAAASGARAVKWLPPAMGIDPASPRCDAFYAAMAELNMPLITHTGAEKAVHGPGSPDWSNPLCMRRALDHGVRIIMAHCGTSGHDTDFDKGLNGPQVPSFELFSRMMGEERYASLLYGDISAVVLANRKEAVIRTLLERSDWHERLMFGSDYPLPGILPLVQLYRLAGMGLIDKKTVPALDILRNHNPVLFDFVLKRKLNSNGHYFAPSVFETRRHFERSQS